VLYYSVEMSFVVSGELSSAVSSITGVADCDAALAWFAHKIAPVPLPAYPSLSMYPTSVIGLPHIEHHLFCGGKSVALTDTKRFDWATL